MKRIRFMLLGFAVVLTAAIAAKGSRNFVSSSSQYAALQSAAATNYPATFSVWFNANSTNAAGTVMVVQDKDDTARFALFSLAGGGFQVGVTPTNGGLSYNAISPAGYPSNTWVHVCAVFASSVSRILYVNGTQVASNTDTAVVGPSVVFDSTHIGTRSLSGTLGTFVNGQISYAAIWRSALNAVQVSALASGVDPRAVSSMAPTMLVPFWGEASPEINMSGTAISLTNSPAKGTSDPRIYRP